MVALAWVPDPFSAKHPPTVLHSSSWKSKFLQEFVTFRNAVFLLTSHVQSLLSIAWEAGTTIPQIWFSIEGSEPKNVTLPRLWLHVWVTVHSGLFMIGLQFLTHLYSIIHMLQLSGFIHLPSFKVWKTWKLPFLQNLEELAFFKKLENWKIFFQKLKKKFGIFPIFEKLGEKQMKWQSTKILFQGYFYFRNFNFV